MIEYDNYHINRCEALEFLSRNFHDFPEHMPNVREVAEGISENIFKGWRFVVIDSGELVFADCLTPCIRKIDLEEFNATFSLSECLGYSGS